ncbi:hypothetical protein KP509_19G076100 [Ceratopteris richardii]|nr:hypothetical protein KP509_19G076100 [Ceratopteris richardii]
MQCDLHTQNAFIGSALVGVYTKCNVLAKAQQVFDELPSPNIVTWNTLMTGFARHGYSQKVFRCFEQIRVKGILPDDVTFLCILKACGNLKAIAKGTEIHNEIVEQGWLRKSTTLGSALVDMYGKCGALTKAQEVFDGLPIHNVISWTGLINAYVQHGHGWNALACFESMQDKGVSPNSFTFACILKACGEIRAIENGKRIHEEIVRKGLLGKDMVLATALVDMYSKCDALERAQLVFCEISVRDVGLWNALITGYSDNGYAEQALIIFEQMKGEGISPDAVTYAAALRACGILRASEKGRGIHDDIMVRWDWKINNAVGLALVDMYAKCGLLLKAQQVVDELPFQDVASWNVIISGYYQLGHYEDALQYFEKMKSHGLSPDTVTFACLLKVYGRLGAVKEGEGLYSQILEKGLLKEYNVLGSALVDMFAKFGAFARAEEVFYKLPVRDVVSWTALIAGYSLYGYNEEAIDCYEKMKQDGSSPDDVTFACVLKACGSIGAFEKGEEVHAEIAREGLLGKFCLIGNALVDMYAKCGALARAQEVFDKLPIQDKVCWTALIAGFCQHGYFRKALHLFNRMKEKALSPDALTLTCILKACGSLGATEKGKMYFESMASMYGIPPQLEHYTCMVVLFGKMGYFNNAFEMTNNMAAPHVVWPTLLSVCQKRGNEKLGFLVFEHAICSDGCSHHIVSFPSLHK